VNHHQPRGISPLGSSVFSN